MKLINPNIFLISTVSDGISPAFERFLDLIGEKVALKGFNDYRGGLDVKGNLKI